MTSHTVYKLLIVVIYILRVFIVMIWFYRIYIETMYLPFVFVGMPYIFLFNNVVEIEEQGIIWVKFTFIGRISMRMIGRSDVTPRCLMIE